VRWRRWKGEEGEGEWEEEGGRRGEEEGEGEREE